MQAEPVLALSMKISYYICCPPSIANQEIFMYNMENLIEFFSGGVYGLS